jgi:CheY-like chemotaxis protein
MAPKKPLILYVDDDDLLAYLMHRQITDFEILRMGAGDDAMEFLNRRGPHRDAPRPALVLLDLAMPKRDGFQILSEIRATPELAGLPVAIFSTSQWPADRDKAFALGANFFLHKPAGLAEFAQVRTTLATIIGSVTDRNLG